MRKASRLLARGTDHVRQNVVGYVALFVALGGVAWAGAEPLFDQAGSVDSQNIANGEVGKADIGSGAVGTGELTPSLTRKLGLSVDPPQDGGFAGSSTSPGADITTVWKGGAPTSVRVGSLDANCAFTEAASTQVTQQSPTEWVFVASFGNPDHPSRRLSAQFSYSSATEVTLNRAFVFNLGGQNCTIGAVPLEFIQGS